MMLRQQGSSNGKRGTWDHRCLVACEKRSRGARSAENTYNPGKKDTDPYNISPIEMRSLLMEIRYIKAAARLLNSS